MVDILRSAPKPFGGRTPDEPVVENLHRFLDLQLGFMRVTAEPEREQLWRKEQQRTGRQERQMGYAVWYGKLGGRKGDEMR